MVVTFDRHPASIVRPESAPRLLTDLEQKLELLAETGIDATVVIRFDEAQSEEPPEDPSPSGCSSTPCAPSASWSARTSTSASHRQGNVALLRELGAEAGLRGRSRCRSSSGPMASTSRVSSTAIRRALAGGEVDVAARLLGRPYEARGIVVIGDQRGRLLGFPTANVEVPNQVCLPADGVYAGWYERPDGVVHPCAINLGRRPTFYEHADHSLLEAHLLDFNDDLYGERAEVRFAEFLRSERKFRSTCRGEADAV